jgi:hypothetical protein
MLCYKDRLFCSFKNCVKFNECSRAMTMSVEEDARKAKLPIDLYCSRPDCYEESEDVLGQP